MCIENLRIGVWFRASHLSRLNLGMRRRVRLCCMLPLEFYSVMSASIKVWYRIPWSSQPPPTLRWKWKHVRRPTINNQHVTSPEKRDFPNMGMRTKWQCGFVCRNVPFFEAITSKRLEDQFDKGTDTIQSWQAVGKRKRDVQKRTYMPHPRSCS